MSRRFFSVVLVSMLLVFSLAAVSSAQKYGGTFYFAMDRDVGSIDPHSAHSVQRIDVAIMMFDQLVTFDSEGNVVPNLAERYEISEDGTLYTFYLRKGVKFHTGRELTAEDVKFSFERLSDPRTAALGYAELDSVLGKDAFSNGEADEISGIRVIDDYTLEIELAAPDATFARKLAKAYCSIVGKEGIGPNMEFIMPVGTGPFVLVEYVPNQHLILERNPNYWQAGLPYLERVQIDMNVDPAVQLMRFQSGQLDYLQVSSPVQKLTLENDPRFKDTLVMKPGVSVQALTMNMNYAPFDKKEVRQAINYAIDRERMVNNVIGGMGIAAYAPLPAAIADRIGVNEWYPYDLEKAKALLAEAGYPNGFSAELVVVANETQKLASEAVQADLAKIGIQVEVKVLESATYSATMNEGRVPFGNMNVGTQVADADEVFMDFLHSSRTPGLNRAAYKNPEFDALVEKARQTSDEETRNELYRQAAEIIREDAPWAVLYHAYSVSAVGKNLKGIQLLPTRPTFRITGAWKE